jgi:hypothetical protein
MHQCDQVLTKFFDLRRREARSRVFKRMCDDAGLKRDQVLPGQPEVRAVDHRKYRLEPLGRNAGREVIAREETQSFRPVHPFLAVILKDRDLMNQPEACGRGHAISPLQVDQHMLAQMSPCITRVTSQCVALTSCSTAMARSPSSTSPPTESRCRSLSRRGEVLDSGWHVRRRRRARSQSLRPQRQVQCAPQERRAVE